MRRTLTATGSPAVRAVRSLHSGRGRRQAGAFLVEGPQGVAAALESGAEVRDVFATSAAAAALGIDHFTEATDQVIAAMAETMTPQGVLAVCAQPQPDLGSAVATGRSVVVLEAVADPGNLGTIIRTADAAGAGAVLLTPGSVDPYNGKVVRSSAGSIFHIPVVCDVALEGALQACRAVGLSTVGATADGRRSVYEMGGPIAWVLGSEAHGLSAAARAAVDETARIPMRGRAESLNVATAAAVCLFAQPADTPHR